jgi:hypothetical protein
MLTIENVNATTLIIKKQIIMGVFVVEKVEIKISGLVVTARQKQW